MINTESRIILLLCLLCLSTPMGELRGSVRGYSSKNRHDNPRETTTAQDPKQGRQASSDTAPPTETSVTDLKTFSTLPIKYLDRKETKEQKVNSNTLSIHESEDAQAVTAKSTKPLLHSLVTDAIGIYDVFQEKPAADKRPEFYRIYFRDKFYCLPCHCYYTFNRSIVGSCGSCKASIVEMNAVLPNDTQQLTIYNSSVRVFRAEYFLQYHSLYNLSVTNNKHMYTIATSSPDHQVLAVKRLDLSSNAIQDIQDRSFAMLRNLLSLSLANNKINEVSKMMFEGLANLRFLNLSRNRLSVLTNDSLGHFLQLEVVDLSRNGPHLMLKTGVFSHLGSLHTLFLHGSMIKSKRYPSESIARLTNLTSLSVDGISGNVSLGPEIQSLRRLVELYVGFSKRQHCHLKVITESFLENVPYLEAVSFSRCSLTNVDVNVYKNVPKLKSLEFISTYPYDIFKALDGLKGLQNSTLKSLSLVGLISDTCPFICLYGREAKYLRSLKLEVIDLSDNRIAFMDQKFIHGLPQTLKTIVIRGNELIEPALLTNKLFFLKHLETLDLGTYTDPESSDGLTQGQVSNRLSQFQISSGSFQKQSATSIVVTDAYPKKRDAINKSTKELGDSVKPLDTGQVSNARFTNTKNFLEDLPECTDPGENRTFENNVTNAYAYNYPAEPNQHTQFSEASLKYLLAPHFLEINSEGLFHSIETNGYTNLAYIDVSYCALTSFTKLPLWIQAANFNGNDFKQISHDAFLLNNSLTYLSLKNNVLGNTIAIRGTTAFKTLHQLAYLDISMNMIYELPINVFKGLYNLSILIMTNNKLGILNTNFSTTPKLEYLDLRKNSITWINKSSRDDLDIIATNHPLYVELTSNPLRCTCEGLEVLHWIWASNIYFVSKDLLRCVLDDGSVEDVGNIEGRVKTLQRKCAGKSLIIVLCVASLVVVCFLVVFGVMYRFRWQLRYIRHIALSRLVGFKPRETTSSAYKFDAFIVYSDMSRQFVVGDCLQELEVKRGHKLCVDDRDFMPGTLSISAIVSAIQNSRKTVLILSPDFYDEEFSEYSVKMALMEEIYQKRSVLYLCVYRPLPSDEMSKSYDLLMIMKRNNYLEFPPVTETSEEVRQCFWDKLSEKIRSSVALEL